MGSGQEAIMRFLQGLKIPLTAGEIVTQVQQEHHLRRPITEKTVHMAVNRLRRKTGSPDAVVTIGQGRTHQARYIDGVAFFSGLPKRKR